MRLYLAGRIEDLVRVKELAVWLRSRGIDIASTWHDEDDAFIRSKDVFKRSDAREFSQRIVLRDTYEIDNSTMLISVSPEPGSPRGSGGRHIEFGYSYGQDNDCHVLGERENLFHYLPGVGQFDTKEALLLYITED